MEIKEIKDGKIILVEKEKKVLTYDDIAHKLFRDRHIYWIDNIGKIFENYDANDAYLPNLNNAHSKKQLEKLLAINKLMNVAKYINDGWQPDWNNGDSKYYIYCNNGNIRICSSILICSTNIYFKSEEFAKQAIEILGEETIRLALCTDY